MSEDLKIGLQVEFDEKSALAAISAKVQEFNSKLSSISSSAASSVRQQYERISPKLKSRSYDSVSGSRSSKSEPKDDEDSKGINKTTKAYIKSLDKSTKAQEKVTKQLNKLAGADTNEPLFRRRNKWERLSTFFGGSLLNADKSTTIKGAAGLAAGGASILSSGAGVGSFVSALFSNPVTAAVAVAVATAALATLGTYKAAKQDFVYYSNEGNTGLSAGALKILDKGLPGQAGQELTAGFNANAINYASSNRFAPSNIAQNLAMTTAKFKGSQYLLKILGKNETGTKLIQDVLTQTLQNYQSGAFGKFGSPEAKLTANGILQGALPGTNYSDFIEAASQKGGGNVSQLIKNINNPDYLNKHAKLLSQSSVLTDTQAGANINLEASNILHETANSIQNSVNKFGRYVDKLAANQPQNFNPYGFSGLGVNGS